MFTEVRFSKLSLQTTKFEMKSLNSDQYYKKISFFLYINVHTYVKHSSVKGIRYKIVFLLRKDKSFVSTAATTHTVVRLHSQRFVRYAFQKYSYNKKLFKFFFSFYVQIYSSQLYILLLILDLMLDPSNFLRASKLKVERRTRKKRIIQNISYNISSAFWKTF